MSGPSPRGPIVIDTDVFSAQLVPGSKLAQRYVPIIAGRPALISFQTVTELRYGALRRGWGTGVERHVGSVRQRLWVTSSVGMAEASIVG